MNDNIIELFRDIKGYEGRYLVSNLGNVKSLNYARTGREQLLKLRLDGKGYPFVTLPTKNQQRVHRLVAIAFIPNDEDKPYINHIDGNTSNNSIENIEWCTPEENMRHRSDTLGYKHSQETRDKIGLKAKGRTIHINTKRSRHRPVRCIETGIVYSSQVEAESKTGVLDKYISNCCAGRVKTAGHLHWEFVLECREFQSIVESSSVCQEKIDGVFKESGKGTGISVLVTKFVKGL